MIHNCGKFSLWGGVVIQGMDFPFRLWSSFSQGDGDSKGGAQDAADGFNNDFGNDVRSLLLLLLICLIDLFIFVALLISSLRSN